ncbi:unannotated protein [freshwater metagenome]|uniref:Unannotated protein n=1 Tax=freshwater metagenome TaxID=449393 RepID=A0A6J6EST9_9ZZZZ|nr:hypothetical protein [Actinomycetota bacterium]
MQQVVTGVVLDPDGAPISFTFENRHYLVSPRPVRWYSRKIWWQQAQSAPKGVGSALVEVEMWRLWATSEFDRIFLELRHQQPEDVWEIYRIDS